MNTEDKLHTVLNQYNFFMAEKDMAGFINKLKEILLPESSTVFQKSTSIYNEDLVGLVKFTREEYEPEFKDGRHWVDILDEEEKPVSDKEVVAAYQLYKESLTQDVIDEATGG